MGERTDLKGSPGSQRMEGRAGPENGQSCEESRVIRACTTDRSASARGLSKGLSDWAHSDLLAPASDEPDKKCDKPI